MRKNILKVFISLVIILVAICFKSIEVERNVESQRFLEEISVIEKNQKELLDKMINNINDNLLNLSNNDKRVLIELIVYGEKIINDDYTKIDVNEFLSKFISNDTVMHFNKTRYADGTEGISKNFALNIIKYAFGKKLDEAILSTNKFGEVGIKNILAEDELNNLYIEKIMTSGNNEIEMYIYDKENGQRVVYIMKNEYSIFGYTINKIESK